MDKEKKVILDMVKSGKITAEEADAMLAQNDQKELKPLNKKFLRVLVIEGGNTKVNINVPVVLAEAALRLAPKDKMQIEGRGVDINKILKMINEDAQGELVNINTMDKGKKVKVRVYID